MLKLVELYKDSFPYKSLVEEWGPDIASLLCFVMPTDCFLRSLGPFHVYVVRCIDKDGIIAYITCSWDSEVFVRFCVLLGGELQEYSLFSEEKRHVHGLVESVDFMSLMKRCLKQHFDVLICRFRELKKNL